MKPISFLRFNALASYARHPRTRFVADELSAFEHADERVLGLVIRDRIDGDFAGIVFARDERLRYRWIGMTEFERSERRARARLRPKLERAAMAPDDDHHQGDADGEPVDFFEPVVPPERLHNDFETLRSSIGFSPARGIIEPMMRWYEDVDGNFIEQFQTAGFDARLWELYLFAAFVELGFSIDRDEPAPDFIAHAPWGELAVEAVTVNPTQAIGGKPLPPPPTNTTEEREAFLKQYMPIKFANALYNKLQKEYWAKPHVRDMPFAIAVEDFSSPGSMVFTRSALQIYLYGYDHDWHHDKDGRLVITPRRVAEHQWEDKKKPSGFFFLPGAENVSAVIFSNAGTISKFNRMGVLAGFGADDIQLIRRGLAINPDPNATEPSPFEQVVTEAGYSESWVEGIDVYHNPRALTPLDPSLMAGAAHIRLRNDGQMEADVPPWHPLGSLTFITKAGLHVDRRD